jgi:L-arabinose isomerase
MNAGTSPGWRSGILSKRRMEERMRSPKIGLLPLYVELYDLTMPEARPDIDAAHRAASANLRAEGLTVVDVPVCRLANEFEEAVRLFEARDVDAIVTLHLAYSPSLESEKALTGTSLPLIIMDTTPNYTYDQHTDMSALMLNHGIHGVQDMCNLLLRNGKKFMIYAGHMEHSDVLKKVAAACRSAMVAHELRASRVGMVGEPFEGMGDFQVPYDELKRDIGIDVVPYDFQKGAERVRSVSQREIDLEHESDRRRFIFDESVTREVYDRSARTSLAIRKWVAEENLSAFTINFLATEGSRPGLPVMPFTECSGAMARGIGYAGEGDVLTAALVGAMLSAFPETTFTEMFCPDWEHGSVFLSHMGEYNFAVADGKPVLQEKPFPFTSAENPTAAYQTMKGGRAVLVNFAPFGGGRYTLTLAGGEMLAIRGENKMAAATNGWFKPDASLEHFLATFSQNGGTHHCVLVYGDVLEELKPLSQFLNCKLVIIDR